MRIITVGESKKTHRLFVERLKQFTTQTIEDEAIIHLLANLQQGRDLEELAETIDVLTDIVSNIADVMGDAGADGGDGGGD
jgi:5-carboxymethyl-2-hydroxymuconate isomerase